MDPSTSALHQIHPPPDTNQYRYAAFISYRHVEPDREWAMWLHKAIETYKVPKKLQKDRSLSPRLGTIFRDEEELHASSDLSSLIKTALEESRYLIVVCSPRTPESQWVNEEVKRFRELGRGNNILALLIEGEPKESFPASLCEIRRTTAQKEGVTTDQLEEIEPLAADVRNIHKESIRSRERMAKLRLLAPILGCRFDELRQREQERQTRRLTYFSAAVLALLLGVSALAVFAFYQRNIAQQKQAEADANAVEASRQEEIAKKNAEEARTHQSIAEFQKKQADEQRKEAERQAKRADKERKEALHQKNIAVSRELATKSSATLSADPDQSVRLAVDAINASQTIEAKEALRKSLENPQWHILRGHTDSVHHAGFSPDGRWVVTASNDQTARVFRCELCDSVHELLALARKRLGD